MQTIDCPLQMNARIFPDDPALICGEEKLSFAQFNKKVWEIADYFLELGLKANQRIAILAPNSPQYIIVLYALFRIKAIACPISTRLPEEAVNESLDSIDCDFLITPFENILTSQKINIKKINLQQTIDQKRAIHENANNKVFEIQYEQDATILFTSGSQGKPKAVLHSFGNHFFNAKGANENIAFNPHDRWLMTVPLYHVSGLSILFRTLLGKGAVVLPSEGQNILKELKDQKITHLSIVPTQLMRLLRMSKEDELFGSDSLKAVLVGGSSVPKHLIQTALQQAIPIYTTYGLTEMASQVATTKGLTKLEDVAQARILKYRQMKIGEHNEIYVNGKTRFKGYVNKDKLETPFDKEGWFATGDLGVLKNNDFIQVTGRKDNMFISGGENIRPEEIERFLCQLDNIEDAIVVPIKHAEFGFRPVAFVKYNQSKCIPKPEMIASIQNRLPKFMTPDEFYTWPTKMEENDLKINRSRLQKLLEENNPDITPIS